MERDGERLKRRDEWFDEERMRERERRMEDIDIIM